MAKPPFQDTSLPCCFIILIFLQLLLTVVHGDGKVNFDVIGPENPILAIVGKDTELPCHLSPNISAEDMELRWFQPTTAWRTLLLVLMALGFVTVGAICVFQKRQRKKTRKQLDEMREQQEMEHQSRASGDGLQLLYDTTNPKLVLSEDLKSVSRLIFEQYLPDNPERFDLDPCVLGQERFTTGRYYWEVEVGNRRAWNLGVCLESLDRKGRIPKSPKHGLWAVEFYKKKLWALTFPRTRLHSPEPLNRVGILLDCEAGNISFYNGAIGSHIYTFAGVSFSDVLRPFFCLWVHDPSPVTICSMSSESGEVADPLEASELPQGVPVTPIRERTFSRDRNPLWTRPMFLSPQSSPTLQKKHILV
ncbi:PREDICTED: butyrophilin subfamily 1 member A1-like [Chrysochloris asiatica]|uniref:Butyrophilin subfamily 1 member A1-like n=1 Tax=Chrysochloris asiatica TaxID=185453 RepID=A0A9B0UC17_CHRAS|nr:PREDICTED: butyrophilin subfamily 1 member A1-like [Chrysochloris asiatica]